MQSYYLSHAICCAIAFLDDERDLIMNKMFVLDVSKMPIVFVFIAGQLK